MPKRTYRWLTALLLSACVGMVDDVVIAPGALTPDGGTTTPDAGTPPPDSGATTQTPPDAGSTPDAGTPPPPDAGTPPHDAGPTDPCTGITCGTGAHCTLGACVCNPGFIADAGTCTPGDPGVPALRSMAQVCTAYRNGLRVTDPNPFSKTNATCDPGTLSRAGIDDALTRLNMHRYLAGLGPVSDEAGSNANAQACSLTSAWNAANSSAHNPQPTATCYTPAGAAGAGSSNIAWGCRGPGDSIDQWMEDFGNNTTYGHRRWFLNPPLGPIGYGYYEGGNNYGTASCIVVFGSSGGGPRPSVISWPPPGFVPVELTAMTWTIQGSVPTNDAGITVTGAGGTVYASAVELLQGNYGGSSALRIDRTGWTPRAGETYHVVITGVNHAPITYDVTPVMCP